MKISKYLYLEKNEYAKTWVEGGTVPLSLASSYRSSERSGIMTPDENVTIEFFGMPYNDFKKVVNVEGDSRNLNITLSNCNIQGKHVNKAEYHQDYKDGYVLCFSNIKSKEIAKKLNKKCCVRIVDVGELCDYISDQIKIKGEHRSCEYTSEVNRNVFLKGSEDEWQKEYRIFWESSSKESISVVLPPKFAEYE